MLRQREMLPYYKRTRMSTYSYTQGRQNDLNVRELSYNMMYRQKDLQSILAPTTAKDINCQRQQINVYEPVDNNSLFISFQTKYNYCRYTFRIQINFFNIGLHQIVIHIFRYKYGANFNANCDYVDSKYNISKMFIPASIIALYLYL